VTFRARHAFVRRRARAILIWSFPNANHVVEKWALAHFFFGPNPMEESLQTNIETRLADLEPEVELVMVDRTGPEGLRLYIDHPGGVDLELCERVTGHLRDLLERFSLEVSSPGLDRPLTKPDHFRRFLGHRVRVRTQEAIGGRRNFTGTLTAADDDGVHLDPGDGDVSIPHERIRRSNLLPEGMER
jgi:ribosome maturation factor RimP